MNNVPANIYELSAVADVAGGFPFRCSIEALPRGDVGVLQMSNVDALGQIDWSKTVRVRLPDERRPKFISSGDIVLAARGINNYAALIERVEEPMVCASQFFFIRVRKPTELDVRFLAWQLNQKPCQDYLRREAEGTYILNIRREVMNRLPIALPPLHRQRAIAGLAEAARNERLALNKLIENRTQLLAAIAVGLHSHERPTQ